jgi:hypothetical protein
MAEFIDVARSLGALRGRRITNVLLPGDTPPRAPGAPRCGLCGRLLRDPASRAVGIGPTCQKRLSARTAPRRTPAAPPTTPVPECEGQTELPLLEHQPTLWSL